MLRVGFDGRALTSPAAGVRRYSAELFGALAAFEPGVRVVAVGAADDVELPPGIERGPSSRSLPTNLGWMLTGLPRAASRASLDLFHAPSYTTPLHSPRPLVVTIHDVSYERQPQWYPYRRDPARRAFYRYSARNANRVITDSEFSKREIIAAYDLPSSHIDVVPLAASTVFAPGPPLPLPHGLRPPYVLHVGDLHARRNLGLLVRAVADARQRPGAPRDLMLVLVGADRGVGEEIGQQARTLSPARPVARLTGSIDNDALLALYRSASALVYPSRYEGFGLPLVEAMACAVPVIAANGSSIPEVVGDAGLLLDPDDEPGWADAIARVTSDEALSTALRARSMARAAAFSWRATAHLTAALYRSAIEDGA